MLYDLKFSIAQLQRTLGGRDRRCVIRQTFCVSLGDPVAPSWGAGGGRPYYLSPDTVPGGASGLVYQPVLDTAHGIQT